MSLFQKSLVFRVSALGLMVCATGLGTAARAESGLVINPFPLQAPAPFAAPAPDAAVEAVPVAPVPVRMEQAEKPRKAREHHARKSMTRTQDDPIAIIQSVTPPETAAPSDDINWRQARVRPPQDMSAQTGVMGAPTALMNYDSYTQPDMAVTPAEAAPVRDVAPQDLQPAGAVSASSGMAALWEADRGAGTADVLKAWADREGVALIWAAGAGYQVTGPVHYQGPFEGAVVDLLDQYKDEKARLVADLHVDPQDGGRTLVVQVFQGS